jgi:hypothetical protein
MGNLIITRVRYSGNQFFYESPVLKPGINIILGDNGSGKSTFTYFIEYAFGGKIGAFIEDDNKTGYSRILGDTNNYVQVDITINGSAYSIKRFINAAEVFVDNGPATQCFAIQRDKKTAPVIFSDWMLEKLGIPVFELNLGATHWYFNFTDLFRLLHYDQHTETRKIYKAPQVENFVADSIVIRKSIFEILLGLSSVDYFKKLDAARAALKKKDDAKSLLDNFTAHSDVDFIDSSVLENRENYLKNLIQKLEAERNSYLKENSTVDDKIGELSKIQARLVRLELDASAHRIEISNLKNERMKVDRLHEGLILEIAQIEKIIFTHDKLDLFSMEMCPFCMTDKKHIQKGYCICGSKFNEDDYEKFVYNSSEYKDILTHKRKSINAIALASETYAEDVANLELKITDNNKLIAEDTERLKNIISTAEFAGNTTVIDDLNNRIIRAKEDLFKTTNAIRVNIQEQKLRNDLDDKISALKVAQADFIKAKTEFEKNNVQTIGAFNKVYNELLSKSSYNSHQAEIDDDYMPFIDLGEYKANSSEVPKRLMYYFTILSLSLSLESVKHPRFLLIDTPENSGIDTDHLHQDIELLETAISLAADEKGRVNDFQVILTTGYGKFPQSFERYVIERFSTKTGNYILKGRIESASSEKDQETI